MVKVGNILRLLALDNRVMGEVVLDRTESNRCSGCFVATPEFAQLETIMNEWIELVNQQMCIEADNLEKQIANFDLRLEKDNGESVEGASDIQIGAGRLSFQLIPELHSFGLNGRSYSSARLADSR